MNTEHLLETIEQSLLIIEHREHNDIVIGVPHHAPAGTRQLPCPKHPDSDENAGYLGLYLARKLNCCSVIACNYPIDVNKYLDSDYTKQIKRWKPRILVEIHGHASKQTAGDIEISSGSSNNNSLSKQLADTLGRIFSRSKELRSVSVCGDYDRIIFKAPESVTITTRAWLAYHIELPPQLRKAIGKNGPPPPSGYKFCDALIQALREIHFNGH